jgi:hypothetical protein
MDKEDLPANGVAAHRARITGRLARIKELYGWGD